MVNFKITDRLAISQSITMPKSLDLSKHKITHMNYELTAATRGVESLNLDHNSISKLENIAHLTSLQQLSVGHNCLIKISGLDILTNLTVLNLPENSICSIEGIGHLTQLNWLNLSGNNIRDITGLQNNIALTHLDLSDNTITSLSDISQLFYLKALLLHGNIIRQLNDAGRFLPASLTILSLAENEITELTQVKNLRGLRKLAQLSLMNNPCISYQHLSHHSPGYRAYTVSWITSLEVLDGQHVAAVCRQNASQLLTGGVLHSLPEQSKLVNYLSQVNFTSSQLAGAQSSRSRPVTAGGGDRRLPVTTQTVVDQGASSPLVSRRDMKGLIRQVIGQERSPGPSVTAAPLQSTALPKMSRSRSGSRSPARDRSSANRKLLLKSSEEPFSELSQHTAKIEFFHPVKPSTPAPQPPTEVRNKATSGYDKSHHSAAVHIQKVWRGYATRNLNSSVQNMKQELRARRLEETLTFLVSEMNRQQAINLEGQHIRSHLLAGIEHLARKLEELPADQNTDVSTV
ncbi:internalin A-like [Watersipora subatra]|uniref:internalin A-like n=1 Tax=Watersipora subatra TaxID=2589382 RepID=UPI00355B0D22